MADTKHNDDDIVEGLYDEYHRPVRYGDLNKDGSLKTLTDVPDEWHPLDPNDNWAGIDGNTNPGPHLNSTGRVPSPAQRELARLAQVRGEPIPDFIPPPKVDQF